MNYKGNTGSLSFIKGLPLCYLFTIHLCIKINIQQLTKDDKTYQPKSTARISVKSEEFFLNSRLEICLRFEDTDNSLEIFSCDVCCCIRFADSVS